MVNRQVKPRQRRRPRGSLTRQQVVEAALQLADQEGLDALSMQTLASRLECGVMTIYGYIDSKEDLLDAIAVRGLVDLQLQRPLPSEPAAVLVAWGRALRAILIAHPSLPVIFLSKALIGTGIFQGIEAMLGALDRAGMQAPAGLRAIYAVLIYTTGFVAWELPRTRQQTQAAYAGKWRQEFAILPPGDFPLVSSVLDELGTLAGDDQFEFGLAALADGLARERRGDAR